MWTTQSAPLPYHRGLRFTLACDSRPATFADIVRALRTEEAFRTFFNSLLAEAPYSAFRWETPAVTADTVSRAFEFVLLDSLGLAAHPDPEAFGDYFRDAAGDVVTFPNLGGDAVLVVPCPLVNSAAYGHLAAFVRLAPESQRHALWQAVGEALERRLGERPVWLSTAGGGVAWLHVRLDDRPKYYGYAAYKATAAG